MNRLMQWVMAAALICGLNVFTACDDNKDQPIDNQERQAFEAALRIGIFKSGNNG